MGAWIAVAVFGLTIFLFVVIADHLPDQKSGDIKTA
jgi:hypothetical protein